jgi:V8-like Glu-specific endopeptidase
MLNRIGIAVVLFTSISPVLASPSPWLTDGKGTPVFPASRSICGKNDMLAMKNASGGLQEMGTPVAILELDMGNGFQGHCTGTMISADLLLTAAHCKVACNKITAHFGFLNDEYQESFKCKEIVESGDSNAENDYMIVRMEGNPGVGWGWYDVSGRVMQKNQNLLFIHHPQATPMKVSKECPVYSVEDGFINHRCDTEPGSSGSAIISPDYENPENSRVVGVHTLGGCNNSETSSNSGPAMSRLVTISPVLKEMAKD